MKRLLIMLLMVTGLNCLGFDPELEDLGGVLEYKADFEPEELAVLGDVLEPVASATDSIKIIIGKNIVSFPTRLVKKFDLLEDLVDGAGVLDKDDPNDLSHLEQIFGSGRPGLYSKDLQNLVNFLNQTKEPQAYAGIDLVKMVYLAIYLGINDWEILKPILNRIKQVADFKLVQAIKAAGLTDFNHIDLDLKNLSLIKDLTTESVANIYWQPNGEHFIAVSNDNIAQIYKADGTPVGGLIDGLSASMYSIYWQPNGEHFIAVLENFTAQIYAADGTLVAPIPIQVNNCIFANIHWQPNGEHFIAGLKNKYFQIFKADGTPVGLPIAELYSHSDIYWQPNGEHFILLSRGHIQRLYGAQVYKVDGTPVGGLMDGVRAIYWQPNGSSFIALSNDHVAQAYTVGGELVGIPIQMVRWIYWQPNGEHFIAVLENSTAQMYTADGTPVGESISKVIFMYWQPKGDFFVVFCVNLTLSVYSKDRELIVDHVEYKDSVDWHPSGDYFSFVSPDNKIKFYDLINNYFYTIEDIKNVDRVYWSPKGNIFIAKTFVELQNRTQIYGFFDYGKLSFLQQILVQAIINKHKKTNIPVVVPVDLMSLLVKAKNLINHLMDLNYIVLPFDKLLNLSARRLAQNSATMAAILKGKN